MHVSYTNNVTKTLIQSHICVFSDWVATQLAHRWVSCMSEMSRCSTQQVMSTQVGDAEHKRYINIRSWPERCGPTFRRGIAPSSILLIRKIEFPSYFLVQLHKSNPNTACIIVQVYGALAAHSAHSFIADSHGSWLRASVYTLQNFRWDFFNVKVLW